MCVSCVAILTTSTEKRADESTIIRFTECQKTVKIAQTSQDSKASFSKAALNKDLSAAGSKSTIIRGLASETACTAHRT